MNRESLFKKYKELAPLYQRVANNTKEALEQFLNENNIPFLAVTCRVKDFDSFFEKISRKNYSNPFNENEDFCGVRVILYYSDDITKLTNIITDNYLINESEDKSEKLEPNEFGYRSNHMIIKIKDSWCVTPNYANLNNLKIELQIRTILMHAWAEIEHKLGYKNKQQIPTGLQRKLYLMSAKLEDADTQFQEIKTKADEFKSETITNSEKEGKFTATELNLDSLLGLLEYYFPESSERKSVASSLLNAINKSNLGILEVASIAEMTQPLVHIIEKILFGENDHAKTSRANLLAYGLAAFEKKFDSSTWSGSERIKVINELKDKVTK